MIAKIAAKLAKKLILKLILTDKFKEKLVDEINSRVDIPKMSEKQEARLFRAIIGSMQTILDNML